MSKTIPLTCGYVAIVDDGDYEWLNQWKWSYNGRYATRTQHQTPQTVYMHRQILGLNGAPRYVYVDHLDKNRLNNTRSNLKAGPGRDNITRGRKPYGVSRFLGVSWDARKRRWQAQIQADGKARRLGRFRREEDAAMAYDKAASQAFGEAATLNFPDDLGGVV